MEPTEKIIAAFRVDVLLKSITGQSNSFPSALAFRALTRFIRIPIGIRIKPNNINPGKMMYIKRPIYEPPKSKNVVSNASKTIETRLKTAKTAPAIDTQFFIDDGNFMLLKFGLKPFFYIRKIVNKL
jgi:hypothetical protein